MIDLKKYKYAIKNLPEGIVEAEIDAELQISTLIRFKNDQILEALASNVIELFVRVSGEKTGYAYTQDLTEDARTILLRAYNNSLEIEREGRDILNIPVYETDFCCNTNTHAAVADISKMKTAAQSLEKTIFNANKHITSVLAEIGINTFSSRVINSLDLDVSSIRNVYYASVDVMAEYEGTQHNTSYSTTATALDELNFNVLKEKVELNLVHQLNATGIVTGKYPALLDSSVGVNIMMTAWQLFSGMKYCDGSSVLSGKLGNIIGSSSFTLLDTPAHEHTGYHFEFDCEGTPSKKNILVNSGKLVGLMHNIASASKQNTKSTGNAGRYALLSGTIPTDIIITPNICYIQKGRKNVSELLNEMGDGIYITESYDVFHSINIGSGEFTIPCRGVIIKEGKKHHPVTEITICGNLLDLFKNISDAGNDLVIENFLRKSYCVGSPSLLIKKLQINGK